jgi:hypothetical protein
LTPRRLLACGARRSGRWRRSAERPRCIAAERITAERVWPAVSGMAHRNSFISPESG